MGVRKQHSKEFKEESIRLVEKVGISFVEAIGIASYNGAVAFICQDRGSLEVGKAADFSVIGCTANINLLNDTYLVIKAGQVYDPKKLLQSAKGKITLG